MSSRYYDPVIGRFINADKSDVLTVSPTSITDKNLYAYCDNNPVMRKDSGGEFWNIAAGAIIGAGISMICQAVDNVVSGNDITDGLLIAGVSGAITGGFAATGAGAVAQSVVSGVVAGATDFVSQVKSVTKGEQESINWTQVGVSSLIGVASGAIGGNGVRHKTGEVAKAKNLYDGFINGIKNRKWNSKNAGDKLVYLANNYRKTLSRELGKTTIKYITGTGSSTVIKKWWLNSKYRK